MMVFVCREKHPVEEPYKCGVGGCAVLCGGTQVSYLSEKHTVDKLL